MRYMICLSVALFVFAGTLAPTDPPMFSLAEQEVLNSSQARRDASNRRDIAASARYVAEDCVLSSDDGVLLTKSQYYKSLEKLPVEYDHSVNPRDFVIRLHGDTAVINFRVTAHEQFGDTDIISEQRRTETWVKQDGAWLLLAMQWDNLPLNFRKPVAVNPRTYKDYVGQYEWRPGLVETVLLKNGKPWLQLDGDEDEYLPLGSDRFFAKSDLGTVTFVRDAKGRVIGSIYHRVDGQEIHLKKVR